MEGKATERDPSPGSLVLPKPGCSQTGMRSQEFPCGWQGDFNVVTFIIFNVAFITEGDTAFDLADSGEILVSKDEANDYYIFFSLLL